MIGIPYFSMLERVLTGAFCILFLILGLLYISTAKEKENRTQRIILYGFGIWYLVGFSFNYIFYTLAQSMDPGYYIEHIFYHEPRSIFNPAWSSRIGVTNFQDLFLALNNNCAIFGYGVLIYTVEKVMNFKVHILSFLVFIFIPLYYFLPNNLYSSASGFVIPLGFIFTMLIILKLAEVSDEHDKPLTLYLFIGAQLFLLGFMSISPEVKTMELFPLELGPILYILASIIWILPIVKPEILTRYIKLQKILPLMIFLFSLSLLLISFTYGFIVLENVLISISSGLIMTILSLIFYIILLKEFSLEIEPTKEIKLKDLSSMFSKPKKLTEEEVSVSKEKKVCLVCKGKVSRFDIYICPDCSSLYHRKCAKILVGKENACWACDAPFDETKPVNMAEKEEHELEIEAEPHKDVKGK